MLKFSKKIAETNKPFNKFKKSCFYVGKHNYKDASNEVQKTYSYEEKLKEKTLLSSSILITRLLSFDYIEGFNRRFSKDSSHVPATPIF